MFGANQEIGLWYDPVRARKLLAAAGYPDGHGFPKVSAVFNTDPVNTLIAENLQAQWKRTLGIRVSLENMEWKVFLSQLRDDPPHIFRLQWYVDYPDADSFMAMMIADSGNNYTRWKNPAYDKLVAEAAIVRDPKTRQVLYDQAQRMLLEQDTAMVPMYVSEKTYLLKPWVQGFRVNPLNLISLDHLSVDMAKKQALLRR